jgi:hypothetical protein
MKDFKEVKKSDYKTIAFDSLTYMNRLLISHIMILSGRSPMITGPKTAPQIQHYGEMKDNYEFLFMEMNKIPDKNVILIAHIMDVFDANEESQKLIERCPLITGSKIKGELPALFKEVWLLHREGGDKRTLYYKPKGKAIANSLLLDGDGKIDDPTYEKILARRK